MVAILSIADESLKSAFAMTLVQHYEVEFLLSAFFHDDMFQEHWEQFAPENNRIPAAHTMKILSDLCRQWGVSVPSTYVSRDNLVVSRSFSCALLLQLCLDLSASSFSDVSCLSRVTITC